MSPEPYLTRPRAQQTYLGWIMLILFILKEVCVVFNGFWLLQHVLEIILNVFVSLDHVERLAAVSLATVRDSRVVLKRVHENELDFFFFVMRRN